MGCHSRGARSWKSASLFSGTCSKSKRKWKRSRIRWRRPTQRAMNTRKLRSAITGSRPSSSTKMVTRSKRRPAKCSAAWVFLARTPTVAPRNSPAAGRCASGWPNSCSPNRTCCCSTSRRTIWISKRATGWSSTCKNRFRYQATTAKQVQSRIKELDKIERIELPDDEKTIHFSFPQPPSSGRMVAEFRNVAKSYGEKQVFQGVNFVINRGDRIALVGVNGAGKSTLIKLLAGAEIVTRGEFRLGHNVEVDYFAQDQYKALDPSARLIDDLASVAPTAVSDQTRLRTLLGCFLFSDEDVFKRIGVLSGGERNRYAMARMLLQPPNFLLLDEPTNHLDLQAKDVLLEALQKFTGTVVFVSHDRYFIDKLATRVFQIEGGGLYDYPGNYEDFLWQKERRESGA